MTATSAPLLIAMPLGMRSRWTDWEMVSAQQSGLTSRMKGTRYGVITGLVPVIHVLPTVRAKDVDGRDDARP